MSEPVVLGIESTCDETAAALVQGDRLLSNVVASSMNEHARYGGVIPEIASRAHAESFVPVVSKALKDADMDLSEVDAIAVSAGPGLAGCHQSRHRPHSGYPASIRPLPSECSGSDSLRRPHFTSACGRPCTIGPGSGHHLGRCGWGVLRQDRTTAWLPLSGWPPHRPPCPSG